MRKIDTLDTKTPTLRALKTVIPIGMLYILQFADAHRRISFKVLIKIKHCLFLKPVHSPILLFF